jgi:TPR repeat protein
VKKRAEGGDAEAINFLGCAYYNGQYGFRRNYNKANKLWLQAVERGCASACYNIGNFYINGEGVERDEKKARYYFELAAMRGDAKARHNLGSIECGAGNTNRAVMHWMISAGAGDDDSLAGIKNYFLVGHATKCDFETALRAHKEAADEMKRSHID